VRKVAASTALGYDDVDATILIYKPHDDVGSHQRGLDLCCKGAIARHVGHGNNTDHLGRLARSLIAVRTAWAK